jgi:hypothetical protein
MQMALVTETNAIMSAQTVPANQTRRRDPSTFERVADFHAGHEVIFATVAFDSDMQSLVARLAEFPAEWND